MSDKHSTLIDIVYAAVRAAVHCENIHQNAQFCPISDVGRVELKVLRIAEMQFVSQMEM